MESEDIISRGRLTLIKSVLGSLPSNYFSLLKVPSGVLKNLESLRNNFFRGNERGDRKLAWVSSEKVLANKEVGGLGCRTVEGGEYGFFGF